MSKIKINDLSNQKKKAPKIETLSDSKTAEVIGGRCGHGKPGRGIRWIR